MFRLFANQLLRSSLIAVVLSIVAPAQTALDQQGQAVNPFATNKVTVLVFIRSDCPISNRYAPEIQRLAQEFQGSAKFWLVYPDRKETVQSIAQHLTDYGYKLPALRDVAHELVRKSRVRITPEAAVFAGTTLRYTGRIDDRAVDFGAFRPVAKDHDLEDAVRAVLQGESVPKPAGAAVGCYISDLE